MMEVSIGQLLGVIVTIVIAIIGGTINIIQRYKDTQDGLKKLEDKINNGKLESSTGYLLDSKKTLEKKASEYIDQIQDKGEQITEQLKKEEESIMSSIDGMIPRFIRDSEAHLESKIEKLQEQVNQFPKHYLHIEQGYFTFTGLKGETCKEDKQGYKQKFRVIKLNSDFIAPPMIKISIIKLDGEINPTRIECKVIEIEFNEQEKKFEFTLIALTWLDSYINEVIISWIAIGYI